MARRTVGIMRSATVGRGGSQSPAGHIHCVSGARLTQWLTVADVSHHHDDASGSDHATTGPTTTALRTMSGPESVLASLAAGIRTRNPLAEAAS